MLFTTGRGTVFGGSVAPCIKVASNSEMFRRLGDDMDFNAGALLEGMPFEEAAEALFLQMLAVASGQPSRSELQGPRLAEFVPWHLGGVL